MRGRGKGGRRGLIHAIPLYDMSRLVIQTFSLLLSLFYLTNHITLIRDSEHTSVYHFEALQRCEMALSRVTALPFTNLLFKMWWFLKG